MQSMTKEEMEAEFGRPGVENANVVDLVTVDAAADTVVLVMFERRTWGANDRQFEQIEEKINRYLGYLLDGYFIRDYPQYAGKRVQICLNCVEAPHGESEAFIAAAQQAITTHGIDFFLKVEAP